MTQMIRHRRPYLSALLCLSLLGAAGPLAAGEGHEDEKGDAPVYYVSQFDGTQNREWVPESEMNFHAVHSTHHPMMMYEVTLYPEAKEPTEEQRRAADKLLADCWRSAKEHGWFDFNKAQQDGFHVRGTDPTHFRNVEFVLDDHILDPDRPEFLMFHDTPEGRKLSGFMFLVRKTGERGPQIGGPLTIWHYHIFQHPYCIEHGIMWAGDVRDDGTCEVGEPGTVSPEMMHVWFFDHPHGPFATRMALSPRQLMQLGEREDP